jgi:probable addiction module antidote protein
MRAYRSHDDYLDESLKNPKEAALYLNAIAQENNPALLLKALAKVARAHGMAQMAKRVALSRMGLYKSLSKKGNPEFKTFVKLLAATGLQLAFKPRSALAA